MRYHEPVALRRNCEAVAIPSGHKVMLDAGDEVLITQSLGGTYTVVVLRVGYAPKRFPNTTVAAGGTATVDAVLRIDVGSDVCSQRLDDLAAQARLRLGHGLAGGRLGLGSDRAHSGFEA